MFNDDDLMNFFRGAIKSNDGPKYTIEDELDDLYKEYIDYINDLKADGYKVMRNDNGKHKVVKS